MRIILSLLLVFAVTVRAEDSPPENITPTQWLKSQPAPHFAQGHTLPPLTRYGWVLPFDCQKELAERWGYAIQYSSYFDYACAAKLDDPNSDVAKTIALAASDPKRYPLALICSRQLPEKVPPETWTRDKDGILLDRDAHSLNTTEWNSDMNSVYSPAAPDEVWKEAGRMRAEPIAAVRKKCPIAIILNGGEYGLGVIGLSVPVWEKDPVILAQKGNRPWFDYISERKARAETLIADAVKAAAPDRQLYVFYTTTGGPNHDRAGWKLWGWGYEWMKPVSDLASSEEYYLHFNSGWTGSQDMLSQALNARGVEIKNGMPLSYNWLCGGWTRNKDGLDTEPLSDLKRYRGFLTCYFLSGMVGGNAGYYTFPPGGFGKTFPANEPPHWLSQMVVLSRVQAMFSYFEDFLRNGDLVPGPNKQKWSQNQPAYELPTGDETARVVARKHRDRAEWLVAAWAADGEDRWVTVNVPDLGELRVLARAEGTLYRAKMIDGEPQQQDVSSIAD